MTEERTPPRLPIPPSTTPPAAEEGASACASDAATAKLPRLEPTRYGDWELYGKCVDF